MQSRPRAAVHPRLATYPVSPSDTAAISITINEPNTSTLEIPALAFTWTPDHAVLAINIVLDFLRLFFQLTRIPDVCSILSDTVKCMDGVRLADIGNYNTALKLAPTIGVDVAFLRLNS